MPEIGDSKRPDDLLGAPQHFPAAWLEERPDWLGPSEKVRVVLDGPDVGRVAGFVSPPPGRSAYLNVVDRVVRTPGVSPSGNAIANGGVWRCSDPDGNPVDVGNICTAAMSGGHSDQVGAEGISAAGEWLGRRGGWAERDDDIVLVGRVYDTDDGKLFLGGVTPWVTVRDAMTVNATQMSGEWHPNPEFGGALDFAGFAKVQRTALPMPSSSDRLPIAAGFDSGVAAGPMVLPWPGLPDAAGPEVEPVAAVVAALPDVGGLPAVPVEGSGLVYDPLGGHVNPPAADPEPVMAEAHGEGLAELADKVNRLIVEFAEMIATAQPSDALDVPQRIAAADERLARLEETVARLVGQVEQLGQQRPTGSPADTGATAGAAVPAGGGLPAPQRPGVLSTAAAG